MPTSGSPTVRRRLLAAELRRLRGNRSGSEVSGALGWSKSKISRYEIGRTSLPVDEVKKLLDFYKVSGSKYDEILSLARDANEKGWWDDYTDVIREEYYEFIGLEAEAASAKTWQVDVVPGLLQTEAYAKELIQGYQNVVTNEHPRTVERRAKVRMIRQQALTRKPPLDFPVVIDESVLLRRVGARELMYRQLQHLAEAADWPSVNLHILPMATQNSLRTASFVIFTFSDLEGEGLHDVVSTEGVKSEMYVEDYTDTYHHSLVFQALVEASLSPAESQALIRDTAENLWAKR